MVPRHLETVILKYAKQYPLIAIIGPRQSGKTTLSKKMFPNYTYVSLENIDLRQRAIQDPRGFLEHYGPHVILDEVQRVPELFSYLQQIVDENDQKAQYILTGSSQFLLIEKITQSLAGRIATFKLYPFSYTELMLYPQEDTYNSVYQKVHQSRDSINYENLYTLLWKGFYPRIYDQEIESYKWYENYVFTYVERDIRSLLHVKDVRLFERFLLVLATLSGQLLNLATLSNALGISIHTVKKWICLLETSGMIFILSPYHKNMSKRIVKTPKLYFADTGVLCYLLSIRNIEQLKAHPLLGAIFETFIVSESFKRFANLGERSPLYFYRDQSQLEIDLLIDYQDRVVPIEIKLAQTYHHEFGKKIASWMLSHHLEKGEVVYCGKEHFFDQKISVAPWYWL